MLQMAKDCRTSFSTYWTRLREDCGDAVSNKADAQDSCYCGVALLLFVAFATPALMTSTLA